MLSKQTIVFGVTGGIAAYKCVDVVSRLRKLGADVFVIMTENAAKFVGPVTFRTISNHPVITRMFEEPGRHSVQHIALAEAADLFVVCPATANAIGKIASGIADDFLTTTIMACTAPKLICPTMNHNMFANPIVQRNLDNLKQLGYHILEPESGRLASGAIGKGRLPEPERIVGKVVSILSPKEDLAGLRIVVTAGPTREWLDPVRYISNPSTGKMGYALARAAKDRGARVYLVSGPVAIPAPEGVELIRVESVDEMLGVCTRVFPMADALIGAAAPGDFRPVNTYEHKIKKEEGGFQLELRETPDILKTLGKEKEHRIVVGFAAETQNVLKNALDKIKSKNLDFICANQIGLPDRGFGTDSNAISIIMPDGSCNHVGPMPKYEIAMAILDRVKSIIDERKN